jgi:tRNA-specific 2-thiouridylase
MVQNIGGFPSSDLYNLSGDLVRDSNTTATLLRIISLGDELFGSSESNVGHLNQDDSTPYNEGLKHSEIPADIAVLLQRVPGCMAEVWLWTKVENDLVHIYGNADSRVARGLLALLMRGWHGSRAETVLQISSSELTAKIGLGSLLPPGRLNGLENMVTLIQSQIQAQLTPEPTAVVRHTLPPFSQPPSSAEAKDRWPHGHEEVAVLLSGGVDSSVALKLLLNQGYRVRAFYLKIWLEDEVAHLNECPWEEDLTYAQQVCKQLDVPLETLNLQKEYWDEVVQYAFAEAREGRTPNPDIMCNTRIKFGTFFRYVGQYFQKVATGHYAQVYSANNQELADTLATGLSGTEDPALVEWLHGCLSPGAENEQNSKFNGPENKKTLHMLLRSPDNIKDQSYFLCSLDQSQIERALFPIGHLEKKQVRNLAEEYSLATMKRKDSQGICFLGKLKYNEFIEHYLGECEGEIRCYMTGEVLGHHRGLWFHTVGQRKGLGPYLVNDVHNGPWFVASKDPVTNVLFVTNDLAVVEQPRESFRVGGVNWILGAPPGLDYGTEVGSSDSTGIQLLVQLRHGGKAVPCTISRTHGSATGSVDSAGTLDVRLHERDKGIAPGQFAAFYIGPVCLGAGVITEIGRDILFH